MIVISLKDTSKHPILATLSWLRWPFDSTPVGNPRVEPIPCDTPMQTWPLTLLPVPA
jgi:hypothetical protein